MAQRDIVRLPIGNYAHGDEIDLGTFAADAAQVSFTLDRCTAAAPSVWSDPRVYVEMELLASFDSGKTWESGGGWGAYGGVHVRRDGTEATFSGMLPSPLKAGGRYKVRIQCLRMPVAAGPKELTEIDARIDDAARAGRIMTRADIGRVPIRDEWPTDLVRTAGTVRTFDAGGDDGRANLR